MFTELLKFVLERLGDLLKDEAKILLKDEKKEIEKLQRELLYIDSHLRDMDEVQRQANLSNVLQTKIQHLREILHEIETLLDEVHRNQKRVEEKSIGTSAMCWLYINQKVQKVKSLFSLSTNPLIRKHKLVKRVEEIGKQLDETLLKPEKYKVVEDSTQVANRRKKRRPLSDSSIMKGEIIIGLEEDVETLAAKFIGKDEESGENSAVVGMGGSGKTTLAKLFYNHKEVKEAFPRRAWVCVSQEWSANDLLIQICNKLGVKLTEDEKSYPRVKLQEFLLENPCLVVLDDVWEKQALEELFPALLSGNGRVLITTRKEKILNTYSYNGTELGAIFENIHARSLIWLWIGEGFVKGDDQSTLEEAGMNILKELAQRCMVQDIRKDLEGDVVSFRIHDLVRDFCIKKANEEGFFFQVSSASTQFKCYRTIINDGESLALDNLHLRTLVHIGRVDSPRLSPFERFKLLRVLSLENCKLGESSKHIGNMVLLRYLKLKYSCSEVENVYFIKRLANLQFLFISQRYDPAIAQKLPDDMVSNMEQLRVLDLFLWGCQVKDLSATILSGVANLRNLQRLKLFPSFQGLGEELQLARSIDLRELELSGINSQQQLDAICDCVTNNFLPHLQFLLLELQTESGLGFDVQKMEWGRCQHLKYLDLSGKMIKPDKPWLPPPKLLSLSLWRTEIEDQQDMDRVINPRLHHLRELFVYNAFIGDKLTLVGLLQLENLHVVGLDNLKEWRIAQDSLPKLRDLRIEDCPELERIPHEIGNIHNLRTLTLIGRNEGLKKRLEKREEGATQGGEDLHLLHNIPTIEYANRLFQRRKKQKDKHQRQIKFFINKHIAAVAGLYLSLLHSLHHVFLLWNLCLLFHCATLIYEECGSGGRTGPEPG
ncbi:hypothetical protein V2J09_002561 [Rumex salicifolius]